MSLALYIHCFSCSNQAIAGACQVAAVRNAIGVSKVALFLENSPKRHSFLEEMIGNTAQPNKKNNIC